MTKKDYIIVGKAIRQANLDYENQFGKFIDKDYTTVLRANLAKNFSEDNPRFDYARFRDFISN